MSIKRRGGDEEANYFYRFTYKGHDFCEGGFRTKAQAQDAELQARNKAAAMILHPDDYAGEMTMRQACEWWLKEVSPEKRSRKVDSSRLPLIADYFDKQLLKEVTPTDVNEFLGKLSDLRNAASKRKTPYNISDHTRNHYRGHIHALYERLIFERMYKGENPAMFTRKIAVPIARCRFIYPVEEKILTPAVAREQDIFDYYMVGMMLGMRMGEMRDMRVEHVDLVMKHIFIPHPKNDRSRYVPFDEELRDPEHAILELLKRLIAGKGLGDYVLPHWGHNYILTHFKAICKATGIKLKKGEAMHIWRHTFAYNLLSQGEPIYKVSKLMGHSSVAVTEKHYGHLAAKDLRDVVPTARPFLSCNRFATVILESTEIK